MVKYPAEVFGHPIGTMSKQARADRKRYSRSEEILVPICRPEMQQEKSAYKVPYGRVLCSIRRSDNSVISKEILAG